MINNYPVIDIFEKPNHYSKISSQMLYGEQFQILYRKKNWLKIKTNYDNYKGFIKSKKFLNNFKPKYKISSLRSNIFIKKNNKFKKTKKFLFFASRIGLRNEKEGFVEFDKNRWVRKKDLEKIEHKNFNFAKIFKLFLNSKYLWGGKTSNGIDCSALVQIYFFYNRMFFPRDTKDQIKYFNTINKKKFSKGDIIFWKGHVGICLSKSKMIHAYGPRKKVLIMPTIQTIKLINQTANLEVKKISKIRSF